MVVSNKCNIPFSSLLPHLMRYQNVKNFKIFNSSSEFSEHLIEILKFQKVKNANSELIEQIVEANFQFMYHKCEYNYTSIDHYILFVKSYLYVSVTCFSGLLMMSDSMSSPSWMSSSKISGSSFKCSISSWNSRSFFCFSKRCF